MSSLRFRLLVSLIATTFLLAMGLGVWHYSHLHQLVTRSFEGTSRLFASQIARQAVSSLFTENAEQLRLLASQSLVIPSLRAIAFLDEAGKVILAEHTGSATPGLLSHAGLSGSATSRLLHLPDGIQIREPVFLTPFEPEALPTRPPQFIGEVVLGFTLHKLNRELSSLRDTVILAQTVFALVAGLLMIALERWVTRPLVALIEKIQAIAQGDLSIRVEVPTRGGELTTLCNSVNHMANALQQHTFRLERMLDERTAAAQRLRSLMENMSNGVMVHEAIEDGANFLVQDLNHAAEQIGAVSKEEALGQRLTEVLPGVQGSGLLGILQRVFRTGTPEHCSEAFYHDHRTRGWREVFVYRLPSGEVVAVYNDISERKKAEEAWRQFNAELDQRVRDRTAQLEVANREMEAFSYSVSHDLRAPLRGIDGWSLALLEDCGDHLDEKGRQYLDRVRTEAQRMGVLIDELLQLSRVTRSKLEPTTVDLTATAQRVVNRLREAHSDRKMDFVIETGLQARGDPLLLEVVLTNLLGNACKFTSPQLLAHIEFRRHHPGPAPEPEGADGGRRDAGPQAPGPTPPEGSPVPAAAAVPPDGSPPADLPPGRPIFLIRDNGVGFDMAFAGKMFGAFQRLHRSSEFPGTGIGLALVARIVHRHGGRIWAESLPGAGATFYFTFGEGA